MGWKTAHYLAHRTFHNQIFDTERTPNDYFPIMALSKKAFSHD